MSRISFASTTVRLWRLFLHLRPALILDYPPRETSQNSRVIQTCFYRPLTCLHANCGLSILICKRSRHLGYSNYTREDRHEAYHGASPRCLTDTVSAALSQLKAWYAKCSSIWESSSQNCKSHNRQDCTLLLYHLLRLSSILSHPSQEFPPHLVRYNLFPLADMNVGVGVYLMSSWV